MRLMRQKITVYKQYDEKGCSPALFAVSDDGEHEVISTKRLPKRGGDLYAWVRRHLGVSKSDVRSVYIEESHERQAGPYHYGPDVLVVVVDVE